MHFAIGEETVGIHEHSEMAEILFARKGNEPRKTAKAKIRLVKARSKR